jgi:hypothetical protein
MSNQIVNYYITFYLIFYVRVTCESIDSYNSGFSSVCGCEVKAIDGYNSLFSVPLKIYLGDKKIQGKKTLSRVLEYQRGVFFCDMRLKAACILFFIFFLVHKINH